MTWAEQIRLILILTDNCGSNPGRDEWSWSTETSAPGLLSFYFPVDPYVFPFVIHWLILVVPNIHDAQRGTSLLISRNIYGMNTSLARLNMDLVWRWYNLLCQYLNSFYKVDSTSGYMVSYIFFLYETFLFVYIILWANWNISNIGHIPWLEELLS